MTATNSKRIEDAILLLTEEGVIKWDRENTPDGAAEANLHLMLLDMRGNDKPEPKFEVFRMHSSKEDTSSPLSMSDQTYFGSDTSKKLVTTVFGSDETKAAAAGK